MRKLAVFILIATMLFALAACQTGGTGDTTPQSDATSPAAIESSPASESPSLAAPSPEAPEPPESYTVTDLLGREVEIPGVTEGYACIGVGSLRLYSYASDVNKLAGVEEVEKNADFGRPYTEINKAHFESLPAIGQGGPNNSPDPERLLNVTPDVIFTTYATDVADVDQLQASIGIPVVALSYGSSFWGDEIKQSLELIGRITGEEQKAKTAADFIASCYEDLQNRTKDIQDKPSVYVGGLGSRGTHGIESTQGQYAPFVALNANNVADETGKTGGFMIDKEQLIEWAPDIMFLDIRGYTDSLLEDYKTNTSYYQSLAPVQNDRVYGILPYNFQTTNIETAIADTYFIGTVIYPEQFADIDPAAKADEIYTAMLGKPFYGEMLENFGGFQKITVGQELS